MGIISATASVPTSTRQIPAHLLLCNYSCSNSDTKGTCISLQLLHNVDTVINVRKQNPVKPYTIRKLQSGFKTITVTIISVLQYAVWQRKGWLFTSAVAPIKWLFYFSSFTNPHHPEMLNVLCLWLFICLSFFVFNTNGFWAVDQTKQAISKCRPWELVMGICN